MLKKYFYDKTLEAVEKAIEENGLGQMKKEDEYHLSVEIPKNQEFGDFAVNVSSLAKFARLSPVVIAQNIASKIDNNDFEVNTVQGFINFKPKKELLNKAVVEILKEKENYGRNNLGNGEKVILEYVSANPTGPFHIGHGRWAAMGSALANVMKFSGYDLYQEFYINDAGSQIQKLGKSLYIRVLQELGQNVSFPTDEEEAKNYYAGEYLIPIAKEFLKEKPEIAQEIKKELSEDNLKILCEFARLKMLSLQQELLKNFNVHFDNFYSELSLHQSGKVKKALETLKELGYLYEKDDALWFASTKFGEDDSDRVIIKSDGNYTYLTADIAYHYDKLQRGFQRMINIWGADHHGYIPRMRASISAFGYNPDCMEVLLGQLVNLVIKGEQVRMGKRTKMITLDDLIEEVGVDATRFWMIMRNIDTTLDFDIELAKSKTDENPVFYVQYAHARACSILRNVTEKSIDTVNKTERDAVYTKEELDKIISSASSDNLNILWNIEDEKAQDSTKKLILKLEEFKSVVLGSAQNRAPYLITKYLQELAAIFHQFYTNSRIIVDDKNLMNSRLCVVEAAITVLRNALKLVGVSAPERM